MIDAIRYQDQPLVSVVVATYNMGQHVGAAVESILAQTWRNLEVIAGHYLPERAIFLS